MSAADSNDFAPLTDDERASATSGTPRPDSPTLVHRYDFSYYEFERKEKAPSFKPHAFWTALSSTAGRPLAKLSVICRNPKHEIDDKTADDIVNQALPSFRLAASTLSAKGRVPPDITIALAGIQYLTVDNPAVSSEWAFFPFPLSEIIPAYPVDKSPLRAATTADSPTKDQINNAPHLSKIARPPKPASDVAASPPPENTSTHRPATAKKHKSKPQLHKSPTVINDESSEDEEPPTKGSVDEQIESMIPEIRAKLREMMVEKKKQGFRYIRHNETRNTLTLTLSAFQGHRTKPFVELVRFSAIEYEQVLQPPGACLLCLMYGITCNPTAGLACTHCNQKKMHTLCDHTWRADKVREVMGGIEEIRGIMFPDAPIVANMIPHLIDQFPPPASSTALCVTI
ncbi:hypothetical protein B0H14DRAFT_3477234 [Mycena olivaceomarginata]|nr:hypothetical protein B0H14DRAFT_3477234 [Mycena olivaceomarginata]